MGKNARIRKWRREAWRGLGAAPNSDLARAYQQKHPDTVLFCGATTEKMSEVLEDFAEPLLRGVASLEESKKALIFASTVWNYALLEDAGEGEPESLKALLADPIARRFFESMLARKRELYPDNRRVIMDFELIPNAEGFQLNVISTAALRQNPRSSQMPS